MNRATIIIVGIALGSALGAYSLRPVEAPAAAFEDTGEPLFDGFADPTLASSLSVINWDDEQAAVVAFSVEQKEGRWVIPSHNDYPADGTERMGKAAASFIDVKKDLYYGDNADDFAKYGVLDPEGAEGKADEKGQRITIKDASGTVLVDIILGKKVGERQDTYYVRYPEEKRVYGSKLSVDISTNFTDWIEKDLLHVERDEIKRVMYDPYKVDEAEGKVLGSAPVVGELKAGEAGREEYQAAGETVLPEGKILDPMKIKQIATAIANIKIVGVRQRPQQLTLQALQSKGFFVTPDGRRLFGNEGQASVVTKDGIVYTLFFGEITFESGLALTAGKAADEPAKPDEEGADPEAKAGNRYMFVDVRYDETLDTGERDAPEVPTEEGATPPPPKLQGPERAQQLRARFDQWFYVISDQSFKQIHKEREELFKDAPAPTPDEGGAPPPTPSPSPFPPPAP